MKFAIIPWSDADLQDNMFYKENSAGERILNDDWLNQMQDEFVRRGDELHTIDMYEDLTKVDFFLFMDMNNWTWLKKVLKAGGEGKTIYCNAEPPVVNKQNTPEGFERLQKYFKYILTWNHDWVDDKRIFIRNNPYRVKDNFGDIAFEQRKLVTGISRNKHSDHPDELYSEREKAYCYYEEKFPDSFRFYGTRWNNEDHPCYGGMVAKKSDIYHQYKFAICYENMRNIRDYVTEKIWDCLTSGIVPIYAGASNIEDYVPRECFIDRYAYEDYEELTNYLINMEQTEYDEYLFAAKQVLQSDVVERISGTAYARNIYAAIQNDFVFKMRGIDRFYVTYICFMDSCKKQLKAIIKKVLKR